MLAEGRRLAELAPNVCVKVPLTWDGLKACRTLTGEGIKVNVTLCFSPAQALLAAKAGATFVSPFVGRLDDIGDDGMAADRRHRRDLPQLPEHVVTTEVLVASVRHPGPRDRGRAPRRRRRDACRPRSSTSSSQHPLTDKGLAAFLKDWEATGQKIVD